MHVVITDTAAQATAGKHANASASADEKATHGSAAATSAATPDGVATATDAVLKQSLFCIHGSASDADTWGFQRRDLGQCCRVITYDRRGTPRSPTSASAYSVGQHAEDAIELIAAHAGEPVILCGVSFGGVCALELMRRRPDLVRAAILCEPPLSPDGEGPLAPAAFRAEFDHLLRDQGGRAAAEYFLRMVLGPAFDRLLPPILERCLSLHEQIVLDHQALIEYRLDYAELRALDIPVLLVQGERSQPFFGPTLAALASALPRAERCLIPGGSHMMHADAYRAFNRELVAFIDRVTKPPAHP